MRPHSSLRGRHQGSEGRWEAMRAHSSRPFCSCDSRWVRLRYLSAAARYTAPWSCRDVDLLSADVIKVYRASNPGHLTIYRRGDMAEAEPAAPGRQMAVDDLFEEE